MDYISSLRRAEGNCDDASGDFTNSPVGKRRHSWRHRTDFSQVDQYLKDHAADLEARLCELLRIPSISADSAYRDDIRRAADWVRDCFVALGLDARLEETGGCPAVFAQGPQRAGRPTVLVYGHYDVQPPDPLDEWVTPPFEPNVRNGNLHARGATDDKGQMFTHIASAEAWLRTVGELPINLKYLIEGEEEVGSEHLETFVAEHREQLACDCVVISDTAQFAAGAPAITYGLRGIAYFELTLRGPRQDLHSGVYGGAVLNPANVLSKIMAALVDDAGRVQVPGFYDDVAPFSDAEREQFAALPFDEVGWREKIGVAALAGEEGFSTLERRWGRPSFDVNGLTSGYQGEGAKTVLPAWASAKFSFRLVPAQDPSKITTSLRQVIAELAPAGVEWELQEFHAAPGFAIPPEGPYTAAASRAIEFAFGRKPVLIREGGSIPVVTTLKQELGADSLLLGWGLDDDNTHSPNEKFCLADFHRGARASARLWAELAERG